MTDQEVTELIEKLLAESMRRRLLVHLNKTQIDAGLPPYADQDVTSEVLQFMLTNSGQMSVYQAKMQQAVQYFFNALGFGEESSPANGVDALDPDAWVSPKN